MKKIEAFIKEHRLDDVTQALHRLDGLSGTTVSKCIGFGRGKPDGLRDFKPAMKIEIYCSDEMAGIIVDTIVKAAHTGLRSDGKIFVISAEQACRISTGECGDHAV
jgi:nitrogen regulatory protein PII